MTFTPKKPDEMRKLAEAATGDVWEWRESNDHGVYMKTLSPGILVLGDYSGCGGPWGDTFDRANAAHIVACSPAQIIHDSDLILSLTKEVEGLREAVKPLADAAEAYIRTHGNFRVRGETEAERRFSKGEQDETAMEAAFDVLHELSFDDLYRALSTSGRAS